MLMEFKARIVIGGNDEDLSTSSFCVRVQSIFPHRGGAHHLKLSIHAVDIKTAYSHAIRRVFSMTQ